LLGDSGTFSGSHNAALKSALEASGLVATVVTSGVANYSDVPAASGFGAILIPVGNSYDGPDMPSAGQSAIVSANAAGKGVLFDGWATLKAYFNTPPQWTTLRQLLLMQYTGNTHNSFESPYSPQRILYTLTSAGHPIWDGLTSPFATQVSLHTIMGPATNSGVEVAFSDLEDFGYGDGPGVVVRAAPGGRIVQLAHASNSRLSAFDPRPVRWFDDPNLLKMFVNAAKWLTRCQ